MKRNDDIIGAIIFSILGAAVAYTIIYSFIR